MERPLGIFEHAQTLTAEYAPLNAVAVLRLSGGPEPDDLQKALAVLHERQPLLRSRLVRRGRRRCLICDAPEIAVESHQRQDDEQWLAVAQAEISRPFDSERGPLARSLLLHASGDEQRELIVTFHHVIMDAASAVHLLGELLALCARSITAADLPSQPLPPPAERLFPGRFRGARGWARCLPFLLRQMADEARIAWGMRATKEPAIDRQARGRIFAYQLPRETTRALVRGARRRRLSLNSILQAASLKAVSKWLYEGRSLPLRYFSFANLRPYLKPGADAGTLVSYYAIMRFMTEAAADTDFWQLAERINEQIYRSVKRGDKYLYFLLSRMMMRTLIGRESQRMGTIGVSHVGSVRLADDFAGIRVRGLHAFVANVPLGPIYTAQVRLFAGQLWWDILYLDTDMDRQTAQRISDDIRHLLETAAAAPDSSPKVTGDLA